MTFTGTLLQTTRHSQELSLETARFAGTLAANNATLTGALAETVRLAETLAANNATLAGALAGNSEIRENSRCKQRDTHMKSCLQQNGYLNTNTLLLPLTKNTLCKSSSFCSEQNPIIRRNLLVSDLRVKTTRAKINQVQHRYKAKSIASSEHRLFYTLVCPGPGFVLWNENQTSGTSGVCGPIYVTELTPRLPTHAAHQPLTTRIAHTNLICEHLILRKSKSRVIDKMCN